MKTSEKAIRNFPSGRTDGDFGRTRITAWFLERPLMLLLAVWISYLVVDIGATLILHGKISKWLIPGYNFMGGFAVIAVFFGVFLPLFFTGRKRLAAVLILLVTLSSFFGGKLAILSYQTGEIPELKSFLVNESTRLLHFFALAGAIWMMWRNQQLNRKKFDLEMEHARLKMEHVSLQLSPHFILNTLSHTSARIAKLSPELLTEFSSLTSLLKYSFKEFNHPNFLNEEVQAVMYYLQCQRLRFSRLSVDVRNQIGPTASGLPMPKLCLLTLVENVFFHGRYEDSSVPCKFGFFLFPGTGKGSWHFSATITNAIGTPGRKMRSGFGAASVFRILRYHFGDRFQVFTASDGIEYSLLLTIAYESEDQGRAD
ncbi:sensor histidine kinase [Algoriphagus terrigena]|uniref:sensor histidine kinase n=1 Tax=Algoriphagus terrigena TaxID=344884 RepID=UPI00040C0A28|nr:histidine kinase [Algoriphagus terrigena]